MPPTQPHIPNPKRVAAGRRNRALRKGLTEDGRRRLRENALRHKPWTHSTGPRTAAGKVKAALNGKKRQLGPLSVREIRAELSDLKALTEVMRNARKLAGVGDPMPS